MARNLKFQTRMAMEVLKCGRRRVWLDPEQKELIAEARSRAAIRDLVEDGLVKRKRAQGGKEPVPDKVRLRKLLIARKQNYKKQKRENRAAAIERHHNLLRAAYPGWMPKKDRPTATTTKKSSPQAPQKRKSSSTAIAGKGSAKS